MKKIVFITTIVFGFIANAQIVNIPDANFKAKLLSASANNQVASTETPSYNAEIGLNLPTVYSAIDTNGDGEIQLSEALVIKWLYIDATTAYSSGNITSMTGIEAFSNLEFLYVNSNLVSSFVLQNNPNIKFIRISSQYSMSQLTSINVSNCTNLEEFECSNNIISQLNVSGCNSLEKLICNNNQLTTLDLSTNVNLKKLICNQNNITNLNVTGVNLLEEIAIDLNGLSSYTFLNQFPLLNSAKLYNYTNSDFQLNNLPVEYLSIVNFNVTNFSLQNLNQLEKLALEDCAFTSFDINSLNVLKELNLRDINTMNLSINNISTLEKFKFDTQNSLISLPLISITLQNLNMLKEIDIVSTNQLVNLSLSNLPVIELLSLIFDSPTTLNIPSFNNLKSLLVGGLYPSGTSLNLNIGLQPLLENLTIAYTNNASHNLSMFPNLKSFSFFGNNNVTDLTLINLPSLNFTNINGNQNLDSIVFENLPIVPGLGAEGNPNLQSVNINNCPILYSCYFDNNSINSFSVLNSNIGYLRINNNQLTTLDVSGLTNLSSLECNNNFLTNINLKNGYNYWSTLDFSNNSNLQYICADEEDVVMVQSKVNNYGYTFICQVNSYCSFTPGGTFYTINGNNRFDGDANGCDATDFTFPNLKINLTNGTQFGSLIANTAGSYTIPVMAGAYTITPQLENPSYFNISPTTAIIDFPTQASPFAQDFCITPNGVHHDLEVTVIPLGVARPGFDASYVVEYKNKGNQSENPIITFAFDDNKMDFLSASVTVTSQSLGLLSWNLGTTLAPFQSGNFVVIFNLNAPTETPPLNGGDFLNYTATINPTATDETPTDNFFTLNQTVVNSYDPNDKTCLEGDTINPSMIGDFVHYQIRFENTGTYPAQNVVVKDMIDTTKFDISSLQMVSTSHSCYTRINGNKVEFIFENINLPFDDATNDGYVVFKIKTLPTLTINSTISNTAEIYFDYNFPIITNTATSTYQVLANPNFDFANEFTLYPNPVKNILNINAKNGLEIQSLEIYNTLGQLVIAKPNFVQTIDVTVLKTGTYFVKVTTEKGSGSVKFIKE